MGGGGGEEGGGWQAAEEAGGRGKAMKSKPSACPQNKKAFAGFGSRAREGRRGRRGGWQAQGNEKRQNNFFAGFGSRAREEVGGGRRSGRRGGWQAAKEAGGRVKWQRKANRAGWRGEEDGKEGGCGRQPRRLEEGRNGNEKRTVGAAESGAREKAKKAGGVAGSREGLDGGSERKKEKGKEGSPTQDKETVSSIYADLWLRNATHKPKNPHPTFRHSAYHGILSCNPTVPYSTATDNLASGRLPAPWSP